jgi:hypothetical protein
LLILSPLACKAGGGAGPGDAGHAVSGPCTVLFGKPNASTGLGPDQCQPACTCEGKDFVPPVYDAAFIQSLVTDWQLATPYPEITSDPYAGPAPTPDPDGTVCGVLAQGSPGTKPRPYTLVTYPSQDAAEAAGAHVTHFGSCGVCSTLANLAIYMANDDLGAPSRACGTSTSDVAGDTACLQQKVGFDLPCAQIWAYDTAHSLKVCLDTCLPVPLSPYNLPDGGLNACIECDEIQSGPVFKAVAGRTRRNSGIPNSICRPCSEVQPLVHAY